MSEKSQRAAIFGALAVFVCTIAISAVPVSDVLWTGDSAVYNEQIESLNLRGRTGHIGYYILGILGTRLSPLSTDHTMNLLVSLFAGITTALTFSLILNLTSVKSAAFVGAFALAFSPMFWQHAAFSHYLMPQTLFILAAYYSWYRHKPLLAAVLFLMALLISPLSALALPGFLLTPPTRRTSITFGAACFLPYAVFVWLFRQDFLFGPRGVFASGIMDESDNVTLLWSVLRLGYHLALNFHLFLVLAAVPFVLFAARKGTNSRWFLLATAFCALVLILFGITNHHIWFHLPFYPLVAVCIGLGLAALLDLGGGFRQLARLAPLLLMVSFLSGLLSVTEKRKELEDFRDLSLEVSAAKPDDVIVIAEWSRGIRFERYTEGRSYVGVWQDPSGLSLDSKADNIPDYLLTKTELDRVVQSGREAWILDGKAAALVQAELGRPLSTLKLETETIWRLEARSD